MRSVARSRAARAALPLLAGLAALCLPAANAAAADTPPQCADATLSPPAFTGAPGLYPGQEATVSPSCTDADGDSLDLRIVQPPAHGTVSVEHWTDADGRDYAWFDYTADPAYVGDDPFTYVADDGHGGVSDPATETVQVLAQVAPTCIAPDPRTIVANAGLGRTFFLACTSPSGRGDDFGFQITQQPQHGWLTGGNGIYQYTPDHGYTGPDSFSYTASNPAGVSNEVTQDVTVPAGYDAPPLCVNWDDASLGAPRPVVQGTSSTIWLICWDWDGDPVTYTLVTPPQHGTLSAISQPTAGDHASGTVTYTADPGYTGIDQWSYRVNDGTSDSQVATWKVDVVAPAPVRSAPRPAPEAVTAPAALPAAATPALVHAPARAGHRAASPQAARSTRSRSAKRRAAAKKAARRAAARRRSAKSRTHRR